MKANGIITLLTDFGEIDGFVGAMKGVILSINPNAKIIDISHEIPAQDIEAGAFVFRRTYHYFPKGTIHIVVIDPGVGSERKILAVQSSDYFFITPDNQVLKYILNSDETLTVVEVLNKEFFLNSVSQTFHGRDIFAPVAAHLSIGVPINKLGHKTNNFDRGKIDQPIITQTSIIGSIIYIDKFGNLITNIGQNLIKKSVSSIQIGQTHIRKLSTSYSEAEVNQPLALIGSSGFLEIAVRNGNASERLLAKRKDTVRIKR